MRYVWQTNPWCKEIRPIYSIAASDQLIKLWYMFYIHFFIILFLFLHVFCLVVWENKWSTSNALVQRACCHWPHWDTKKNNYYYLYWPNVWTPFKQWSCPRNEAEDFGLHLWYILSELRFLNPRSTRRKSITISNWLNNKKITIAPRVLPPCNHYHYQSESQKFVLLLLLHFAFHSLATAPSLHSLLTWSFLQLQIRIEKLKPKASPFKEVLLLSSNDSVASLCCEGR